MLNVNIENATKHAQQQLEKIVVEKLKAISSYEDYADLLKYFYAYIIEIEKVITPFITEDLLPGYKIKRNSYYLENDIGELLFNTRTLPNANIPSINNKLKAFGALYVLEGSALKANIIVQMLKKKGIVKGVSFFSDNNHQTSNTSRSFISAFNQLANNNKEELIAIQSAEATLIYFARTLDSAKAKS